MKKEISGLLKKDDLFIFVLLILIYLSLFFIHTSGDDSSKAYIYYNGKKIVKSLLKDENFKLGNALVVIKDKKICIEENDCPSQQCVHMGKISREGQFILCSYYNILIKIDRKEGSLDAISY